MAAKEEPTARRVTLDGANASAMVGRASGSTPAESIVVRRAGTADQTRDREQRGRVSHRPRSVVSAPSPSDTSDASGNCPLGPK